MKRPASVRSDLLVAKVMRPTETKRISLLTTAALASTGNGKSVGVVSSTTAGVGPGLVACAAVCLGACCWVACLVGLVCGAFAASARDGHSRVISIIKTSGRMCMGVWPRVPRCISARAAMLEPPFAPRGRDRYHARSIIEVVTMSETLHDSIRAVEWTEAGLKLLDQRALPLRHVHVLLENAAEVADAIRDMVVRGAPAIGVTAAYGVVLAARDRYSRSPSTWRQDIEEDFQCLAASRPTAVNLFWAVERMRGHLAGITGEPVAPLLIEARKIHAEDVAANRRMGARGAACIQERGMVLTHCNTGSLATGGYGTALGVIRSAYSAGKIERVYADETRPWLQGARLTARELVQDEIPVTLIADGAAAQLMKQGGVTWAIVGDDRIATNGQKNKNK